MTFEPLCERDREKQEVVKVTLVNSILQAKNEPGVMMVTTRVIVHKKLTHTHILQNTDAVCVSVHESV